MKFVVAIILLSCAVFAQLPTPQEIALDFQTTFDKYNSEAVKFVEKLAGVLDARLSTYVASHEKLTKHFEEIRQIPGLNLTETVEQTLSRLITRVRYLIGNYPKVLDRNIFSNEMKKHMDILKTGYLVQAQELITELVSYVTRNPNIGKCWEENRDELLRIVQNGFISARDAAITTVTNANATLYTNEVLIDLLITADKNFIEMCKSGGESQVNGCIGVYLTISDLTFPASSSVWELTTNSTVATNLIVAESLIRTATQIAVGQVTTVVSKIENCVVNTLRNNSG